MRKQTKRSGITRLELSVVVASIGVLAIVLLPACRQSHEPSRRAVCMNNLRQLALAALSYESSNMELPTGVGRRGRNGEISGQPLSGVVRLLPMLELQNLYDEIRSPTTIGDVEYPAFGVPLSNKEYSPWAIELDVLLCPSSKSTEGQTSYAFSVGDVARGLSQQKKLRGAYGYYQANGVKDVTDGCSNTIGMMEIGGGGEITSFIGGCITNGKANWLDDPSQVFTVVEGDTYSPAAKLIARGSHWADGRAGVGLVSTILPPNSPSFQVQGSPTADGIYSAGSKHPGGVVVSYLDGSARFVSEDVDTGDLPTATLTVEQMESETPLPSPHGVWGAMGSINGDEMVELE